MVAKKQLKVTVPDSTIAMIDHYRTSISDDGVSRAVFVENAIDAYVREINRDYRGNDLVIHRVNQILGEIKLLSSEVDINNQILQNGFDTLFNLTKD